VCEEGDVTLLCNPTVHTDREVTANRSDIIIKNKKRENMHTDRCGNIYGETCHAKGSGKETKVQKFVCRDTTNEEHEMYDYAGNNWSQRNSNKNFKKNFGRHRREIFDRFTIIDSCTWSVTYVIRKVDSS